ncbi:MAG: 2-oxoacid:acceptor oxidoreductase subunit alpha [Actinomycetota bacterium]|nr:2-oxoacid:acceptor oxidoreductase subunit alpha [Actinomycetota bacterium]
MDRSPGSVSRIGSLVVRFAGDSGDGMQVTGDRFTAASALFGNDLATFPSFPAEIRAPAGTLAGVSAFQVHIADHDILTPGDAPTVLVAMNPAALRANLSDVVTGGSIIVNSDAFDERSVAKAGYGADPLSDGSLAAFRVYEVPMTTLTVEACKPVGAKPRDAERSKNFFALGLVSWLYHHPLDSTIEFVERRYAAHADVVQANTLALRAGWNFGETTEVFESSYEVPPSTLEPGTYTNVSGNTALAWGLIAGAHQAGLSLFLGSYPITPASDILHELAKQKHFGIRTLQAEDEIAGVGAALGASYGGALGVTTTSGPGIDLKSETVGLAVSLELPLVIVDVQRGGPSTGLPTKTEQGDLLHAMYGRHGEAPVPIIAASTPSHCFEAAIEAVRIAVTYRTPVYLLTDGYLANGAEPWRIPDVETLPRIDPEFQTEANHTAPDGTSEFLPYLRDPETLARPWAVPGTPGLEHRIGGIEKHELTGDVSYDPGNHSRMVHIRADRVARISRSIPPVAVDDPGAADGRPARLLVLGWGSTYGAITAAVRRSRANGLDVAQAHLVHLNPFPENLREVLARYEAVLVPETNLGQLVKLVRAAYLVDAVALSKVEGRPFLVGEVESAIAERIGSLRAAKETRA